MATQQEPTLEEVLAQVKVLATTVERLIEAKKPAPAAKPAQPALSDFQPAAGKQSHTFTIPQGSAREAFNNATPAEAVAVPNYYMLAKPKAQDLVDIPTTLAALAMETVRGDNRKALYPVQLEDYISTKITDREKRLATDIILGRSQTGIGLVALKAKRANGKTATLYAVEDQLQQKMLVVGPEPVDDDLKKKLGEFGVSYVSKGQPDARNRINAFLNDSAYYRGNNGLLERGSTQLLADKIIKACSLICEIKESAIDTAAPTLGDALLYGAVASQPSVYTSILKASARPPGVK